MATLLTEADVRAEFRNKNLADITEYKVEKGTIVTPSAKAFLAEKRIRLVTDGEQVAAAEPPKTEAPPVEQDESNLPPVSYPQKYESVQGGVFEKKPEFMTQIYGNKLVFKDHKIVRFRGAIDSFEAKIIDIQLRFLNKGMQQVVDDLQEIMDFVRMILRCEVLNQEMQDITLLNMDSDEIRARSHNPKKYYNINHFAPDYKYGEEVAALNLLRVGVREVELAAYDAFKDEYGVPARGDIIKGLNRLSSLFYIMMFRILAKEYR